MSTPITFLSDYGLDDDFVGVCHAVMAGIAPTSRVIDLSHGVPRHDVRSGALVLRRSLPYCLPGVHLAVVDPEAHPAGRRSSPAESPRRTPHSRSSLKSRATKAPPATPHSAPVTSSPKAPAPVPPTHSWFPRFA